MPGNICRIVRKSTQREGVFIDVLALAQHLENEVSTAHVVHQVAEVGAAEGVVTQILNDGATICVGMGFFELFVSQTRIPGF